MVEILNYVIWDSIIFLKKNIAGTVITGNMDIKVTADIHLIHAIRLGVMINPHNGLRSLKRSGTAGG